MVRRGKGEIFHPNDFSALCKVTHKNKIAGYNRVSSIQIFQSGQDKIISLVQNIVINNTCTVSLIHINLKVLKMIEEESWWNLYSISWFLIDHQTHEC